MFQFDDQVVEDGEKMGGNAKEHHYNKPVSKIVLNFSVIDEICEHVTYVKQYNSNKIVHKIQPFRKFILMRVEHHYEANTQNCDPNYQWQLNHHKIIQEQACCNELEASEYEYYLIHQA